MLTYSVKLSFASQEEKDRLFKTLEGQRFAFNEASKVHFGDGKTKIKNSIVELHAKFYKEFRKNNQECMADIVIAGEQECLSSYRSVKSNKHKIDKPISKKRLSCRLNKNLYRLDLVNKRIKLSCFGGKRIWANLQCYDKVNDLISKYDVCDPLLFEKDSEIWLALTFKVEARGINKIETAIGVDLGLRRTASTSEGKIFHDKEYLKNKRKIRFQKRQLQSCVHTKKSKSAKRKLKKLRRKESNQTKNFCHHLCNQILKTDANVIVIEDLSQIKNPKNSKKKKYKKLNNKFSQAPFHKIRTYLTYKALLAGKRVEVINPSFTSQIDWRTSKKDGERRGCRYIGADGVILDADLNAANNIAMRSKLPVSSITLCKGLDGQAIVNSPIVRHCLDNI